MTSPTPSSDPRIAPATQRLATVAAHVHAIWARMGISEVDRQRRWDAFLSTSLLPFIDDFGALQASAEYNAATENDVLLREVCYLATRLDEAPQDADVATIVSLLKRHYARTPMQSPLLQQHQHQYQHQQARESVTDGDTSLRASAASATSSIAAPAAAARRSTKELMFLSLPSFTETLKKSAAAPAEGEVGIVVKKEKASTSLCAAPAEDVNWIGRDDNEQTTAAEEDSGKDTCEGEEATAASGNDAEGHRSPRPSSATEAKRALLHMARANTHEGVRRQLQSELDRLQALADNRLRVLQLLYKQKAILSCSPSEQVRLRAAYRAKYLGEKEKCSCNSASELEKRSASTTGALAPPSGPPPAVTSFIESSISPPTSSHFLSLPPSPKPSDNSSSATTTASLGDSLEGKQDPTHKQQQQQPQGSAVVRATTQAELQLLLSAASCTLDTPFLWDVSGEQPQPQQPQLHQLNEPDKEERASASLVGGSEEHATWPTSNSTDTSTSSQVRSTQATTAIFHPAPPSTAAAVIAGRPTVFELDVSSITAYGTHQDLSLKRIQQDAELILAAIADRNCQLQAETQAELQALDTLEVLWRAMSAQKASPSVSSQLPPLEKKVEAEEDERSEESAQNTLRTLAKPAAEPLAASLQPVPFAESKEQVMARYAQLIEAFAADVAAQRAAPTTSTSQPSSLSSSTRGTAASRTASDNADTRRAAPCSSGDLYLPPSVRQVLRAPSFTPVFDYVHCTRVAFQKHLSAQQDALVKKAMDRLRTLYEAYYTATRDSAYAVAPDGELRVAMEEELLETLQASEAKLDVHHVDRNDTVRRRSRSVESLLTQPSSSSSSKVLLSFQRHLTACQQVREQAADEIEFLRLRLHILEQAEPLVVEYQSILREEADMRASSRERLLSKKVNMAKQLLQEEKVRRRVAKDLPRIVAHLTTLVAAWDALQAADVHNDDTHNSGDDCPGNEVSHNSSGDVVVRKAAKPSPACVELCIHGQRVRDLLGRSQGHAGATASSTPSSSSATTAATTATMASRTRPRSVSAHATTSSRSASPALRAPSTSRARTEASSSLPFRCPATRPRNASPALARTPPSVPRGASRSPSFFAVSATAVKQSRTPPPTAGPRRHSPAPPLVPWAATATAGSGVASRVCSLSPAPEQGLSARAVNAPAMSSKAKSQSPVPVRGESTPHHAPFSTNFKTHH